MRGRLPPQHNKCGCPLVGASIARPPAAELSFVLTIRLSSRKSPNNSVYCWNNCNKFENFYTAINGTKHKNSENNYGQCNLPIQPSNSIFRVFIHCTNSLANQIMRIITNSCSNNRKSCLESCSIPPSYPCAYGSDTSLSNTSIF